MGMNRSSNSNPGQLFSASQVARAAPVFALLALAMTLMAACGSNGPDGADRDSPEETPALAPAPGPALSMQDYYSRLQEAFERLGAAAEDSVPKDLTSTEQLLPFLKDSLSQYSIAMNAFADEVDALNPPPQITDAHSVFESALRADAESTAELAEKVQQSSSLVEVTEVLESRNTTLLQSREPCRALQEIAVQAGIPAALPCDE